MHLVYILGLILVYTHSCESIKCYDCNSDSHPSCGDPFDPKKNEDFLRVCDTPKTNISVPLCRKIDHYIKDYHRVIRSCGWIPYKRECYNTGREKQRTYVCACSIDECNNACKIGLTSILVYFLPIFCIIKMNF